jgi:proteasome lid subunit RPN8/RPN11
MLYISEQLIEQLIDHAKSGLPEEVCGYLSGIDRVITTQHIMTNIDHSPEHFSFDPAEQFKVVREVRNADQVMLANYHSHPESPARPSVEDIRLAYDPNISYIIVSLHSEIPDIKSFRIQNGEVEAEEIIITL